MELTIAQAAEHYLDTVRFARSANTARTYRNAIRAFLLLLDAKHSPGKKKNAAASAEPRWTESTLAADLSEDAIGWFAENLKVQAPTTEQLYLTAVAGFYEYLAAEQLAQPNLPRVRLLIKQRSRRPGQRLPQFPHTMIDNIIDYAIKLAVISSGDNERARLALLRDRALLIILADTGLRIHEACELRRGDLDWNEGRAQIIGKGDREAVVRFSRRSLEALKDYLAARSKMDGSSGRPLQSLPLFARHDKRAGKNVKPITTTTGRNIVHQRAVEALGTDAAAAITPHSFRHYFVTTVLRASGGNLKLAQELARHQNIAVTQRYAHLSDNELDEHYFQIFESDAEHDPRRENGKKVT